MLRFLKKHGKKFVRAGLLIAIVVAASTMMTSSVPAAEDNTNKLISVGISAGDGSDMASVLQMLLVLTVIALAPSNSNYADIIYKNSYRITFYQNCVRNADNPAKSDYCGLVFIFNSFCNVADI